MSEPISSPFFRLPRELRDQIYTYVFETAPMEWLVPHTEEHFPYRISFPDAWTKRYGHNTETISHAFPALCCASRQLFYESVPRFLTRVEVFTFNTETTKKILDWLAQFENDEAFKAIKEYMCYEWTVFDSEAIDLQFNLVSRMINLETLYLQFTFPELKNCVEEDEYDWTDESYNYSDTGIAYSPRLFYIFSPDRQDADQAEKKWPVTEQDYAREKLVLQEMLDEFIKVHRLDVVLKLSKLEFLELHFDVVGKGQVRHNLSRPLYMWFKQMWAERERNVEVLTGFSEDT